MAPRLMLLDSASMYFRAFFGVPDRFTGLDGTPTNAVRGFLDAVTRLIDAYRPDELVACWDDDWRPQFRVDLIGSYKAHRVAGGGVATEAGEPVARDAEVAPDAEEVPDALQVQEPIIVELLAALGICRVGAPGFEADDVIAQYARTHSGGVDIVSGDRDLFQLVDDARDVRVLYTARGMGRLQVVDGAWVQQKYGVAPQHYADLAILRGDSSDGLPGVSGVGEKTAARLIGEFGGVAGIMAAAADPAAPLSPSLRGKLTAAADYIRRADPVVRLIHEVPVPPDPSPLSDTVADPKRLAQIARDYRLSGPVARLTAALADRPLEEPDPAGSP